MLHYVSNETKLIYFWPTPEALDIDSMLSESFFDFPMLKQIVVVLFTLLQEFLSVEVEKLLFKKVVKESG